MESTPRKIGYWSAFGGLVGIGVGIYKMNPVSRTLGLSAICAANAGVASLSYYSILHVTKMQDNPVGAFCAGAGTAWWMTMLTTGPKFAIRNMVALGLLGVSVWAVEREVHSSLAEYAQSLYAGRSMNRTTPEQPSTVAVPKDEPARISLEVPRWFPVRPIKSDQVPHQVPESTK